MPFLQRLSALIDANGITKNKLFTDLGINKNSFVDWEKRNTIPSGDILLRIANYFNVSVDYLLGCTDKKEFGSSPEAELSDAELSLISLFRKLPPEEQNAVIRLVQAASGK